MKGVEPALHQSCLLSSVTIPATPPKLLNTKIKVAASYNNGRRVYYIKLRLYNQKSVLIGQWF